MRLPQSKFLDIRGQSLIGILVALAIFSILSQAIFTVVSTSLNFVSFNRARITARHLAQEKIEFIRNLPYSDVGTQGGVPPGPIPQQETVNRNGLSFTVKTEIIYIDDPFDGTQGGSPEDTLATDYKRVRVEVSWRGKTPSRAGPVVMLTDISPKGVETTVGGGTLSIIVFDASGQPVPQATVNIAAPSLNPPINITTQTGDNGRVIRPGMPVCNSCYQITVSKSGYSSERTYSTSEVANPTKPHQTILEGQLTEVSFSIDRVSTLTISSFQDRDNNFNPLPNIVFRFRGQKTIGTDTDGSPVYKYDQILDTGSSSTITLSNVEWDNYQVILPDSSPYNISGTNPLLPLSLLPNTNVSLKIALSSKTINNLLVALVDTSGTPIASATTTLSRGGSYNQTKFTGLASDPDFGQAFYPDLLNQTYTLSATASGFLDLNTNIDVDGVTQEKFVLTPQ